MEETQEKERKDGDIFCRNCLKVTPHRVKGTREISNVCNVCDITNLPIMLIRENDGKILHGNKVKFVEWESPEIGSRYKSFHDEPQIGFSCIIDPQYIKFTWLTTTITEITNQGWDKGSRFYEFNTSNSKYKLYIAEIYEV
jgi:hypothetical protein